ncbi:TetR/AcrR family transcriptional regulator [Corynebacterium kozikiae]|uniref:TetR/AcrR family transcriptional regulator n=1 Tax=Corynebacterium kozikiae TaxID=2968469 RepID=UPI00211BCDF0|nr:TetR/AcrR family transcriptional regulator [Corynebacterium sp. 76QC2CO]MCQ9343654.1 TetR/AcrR family transcriptional regulator [Corynebacterium sp. 76QC2CO]
MRTSKKAMLLEKAIELVEQDGLAALTYDSLSAASGVSKSGLIYHFPSRMELLRGMHQALAEQWVSQLTEIAGGPASQVSPAERLRAMVLVHAQSARKADLLLTIDSVDVPELNQIWQEALDPWTVDPAQSPELVAIQLLADGLWVHDMVATRAMSIAERERATQHVLRLIDAAVQAEHA